MKKSTLTACLIALCCAFGGSAQTSGERITKAMMDTYDKVLRDNPGDYETYYRRAAEYYRTDQYLRALSDIDKALELTPPSQSDLRFTEYILRSNIYQNTGEKEKALIDLEAALAINPGDYVAIYQKANTELELDRLDAAKTSYQRLQGMNPRSLEALFGLSRVAVKQRDYAAANEYADKAVAANPNQADAYIRRASVRRSMGNNTGAVDDLILALSTDHTDSRAIRELVIMGNTDYAATITGLSNAVRQAPKVGMFRYIRAMIEMAHYRYKDAIADFKVIIDDNLYNYAGIYASMAQCQFALGKYAQASSDIEYAIGSSPAADYYVTLSQVRLAQWRADEALTAVDKALSLSPNFNEALLQKAVTLVELKRYDEASDAAGEAVFNDGENALALMARAWILNDFLKQAGNAKIYYKRVIDLPADIPNDYLGFAYLFTDRRAEGDAWIEKFAAGDTDGYTSYLACCYYAQAGDADRALDYMERSLKLGYANYYDWTQCSAYRVNVAPIRDNARFNALLTQYNSIF